MPRFTILDNHDLRFSRLKDDYQPGGGWLLHAALEPAPLSENFSGVLILPKFFETSTMKPIPPFTFFRLSTDDQQQRKEGRKVKSWILSFMIAGAEHWLTFWHSWKVMLILHRRWWYCRISTSSASWRSRLLVPREIPFVEPIASVKSFNRCLASFNMSWISVSRHSSDTHPGW